MALEVYYNQDCDQQVTAHYCNECDAKELAKVRGFAYIHKSFVFTDPTLPAEWIAGIQAGKIIIIPEVNGEYDGGSEKTGPGFGNQTESFITKEHILKFQDPNLVKNWAFYQSLRFNRQYKAAYITETQLWLIQVVVKTLPKAPVQNDMNQFVVWDNEVKWNHKYDPQPFALPAGVFECFLTQEAGA